jgi:hypothetical protein
MTRNQQEFLTSQPEQDKQHIASPFKDMYINMNRPQNRRFVGFCASAIVSFILVFIFTGLLSQKKSSLTTTPAWWLAESERVRDHSGDSISGTKDTLLNYPWMKPSESQSWEFDPRRDDRNLGLSDSQCQAAFPDYYQEINRAVKYREDHGLSKILSADLDISWRKTEIMRCLVYDGQLYILDVTWHPKRWDVPRAIALLSSIHRAILLNPWTDEPIPNMEFVLNLSDWPNDPKHAHVQWILTRKENEDEQSWLMPDFGYWSWPEEPMMGEYADVRRQIRDGEPAWEGKVSKAVWRGALATNDLRKQLVKMTEVEGGDSWSDIKAIDWNNKTDETSKMMDNGITMPEHCDYKYLVHTEGHSYSGRGKYLLNCQSVSIIHTPEWIEPHTHLFENRGPRQNMVSVHRDFSNLEDAVKKLSLDQELAQRIADNSVAMFRDRYLTPAAQACYWRKMFRAWKGVMGYEPELYKTEKANNGGKQRRVLRGTPYESFIARLTIHEETE